MKRPSLPSSLKLITLPLAIFLGSMIFANIASNMQRPMQPLYLQHLGANIDQIGLFFTLSMIIPMVFQILGGWLSDTIGRLRAVAIGSTGGLFGFILFAIAPTWEWLLIAQIGLAMAYSFVGPSFQAFIAEQSSEENRGKVFGMVSSIYMVVGIIGPPLAGILADNFNFTVMLWVATGFYAAATFIRLWLSRRFSASTAPKNAKAPSFSGFRLSMKAMFGMLAAGGIVTWIFISDGVRDITFSMSDQFYPIYMNNLNSISMTEIGWLMSLSSLATLLVLPFAGNLSDKKGERFCILSGFGIILLGLGVFLLSHSFITFALSWMLFGVGGAIVGPAYDSLISKAVPQHLRGTAYGLFSTSLGLISLPAPYIGALLWNGISPLAPFLVNFVGIGIMLPVIYIKFRLPNEKPGANLPPTEMQPAGEIAPAQ
jgi:DHA1 family multidrug resistance protein-like MFS transporter